jgi:putative nucleotidyltransferase-like protein
MAVTPTLTHERLNRGQQVASALAASWRVTPPAWEPSRLELGAINALLLRSGAGALAWRRLRTAAAARTPSGFELQQAYRLHAIQALLHERQLARVLNRLRGAGVQPLLGKGWAAARHYPEAGLRPYGDFDLYVGSAQREAARVVLEGEDASVDLHTGCAELNDRPWSLLNERARSLPLGGGHVRVFGAEDHLRLLALHMLRHGAWRPLWLCDLGALLETSARGFDWRHFLSGDQRRTDWVCCALVLARDLVGAALDGAPEQVTRRTLPAWLHKTVLRQWADAGFEAQGRRPPMVSYAQRPAGVLRALRSRWPNAIEATVGVRGPFNGLPRLPFQLAECVSRTARFTLGLSRVLARASQLTGFARAR